MSADDNAPEQAREVEVVRGVLRDHGLEQGGGGLHSWRCDHPDRYGECDCLDELLADLHAALTPIRAAERQEAARKAAESALRGAARAVLIDDQFRASTISRAWAQAAARIIDDRADGATGRSGT